MTRFLTFFAIALVGLLFTVPSNAGSYGGYNNYGHGNYFNYYPTIPTYGGYGYGYQSYYQPTYNYGYTPSYSYAQPTYSYAQPSYSAGVNYKDGNYHYHEGQEWHGRYWPAGQYRWDGNTWIMQGADLSVPVAPDDWKQTLLKVSAKRDEYAAYLAALKAMGVSPPPDGGSGGGFAAPHGGTGYGVNRNSNLGTYGANASTLYGYTVQNVQSLYGDASTASLFQQAQQLATNAQALGGEATKQFQANVAQDGQNRQRTAEALARGLAAAEALRAAQGSESHQSSSETRYSNQPPADPQQGQQQGPPPPAAQPRQQGAAPQMDPAFVALASSKCLKCHDGTKANGNKLEGGFDFQQWQRLSVKDKIEKVLPRLTATDDKRMPRGGEPLTPAEIRLFLGN